METLNCSFRVELRGFEPLTPSMRTRCATGLRYSPENLSQPSKRCALPAHHLMTALRPGDIIGIMRPALTVQAPTNPGGGAR
jgi:hypothetical protein